MIKPLGVHILIEPVEEVSSSIVLPETTKGAPEEGIVRGVGSKVEDQTLKDGDRVIFRKYAQEEFEVENKRVFLVEEQDVMGVYA